MPRARSGVGLALLARAHEIDQPLQLRSASRRLARGRSAAFSAPATREPSFDRVASTRLRVPGDGAGAGGAARSTELGVADRRRGSSGSGLRASTRAASRSASNAASRAVGGPRSIERQRDERVERVAGDGFGLRRAEQAAQRADRRGDDRRRCTRVASSQPGIAGAPSALERRADRADAMLETAPQHAGDAGSRRPLPLG